MDEPVVVAHVLLRSLHGQRPGVDAPIAADTIDKLAPPPHAMAAVVEHFRRAGFEVLGQPGITIGISGAKRLFEQHFGVELTRDGHDAYAVRRTARSTRKRGAAADAHDATCIPDDRLPAAIRAAVSQIALEAGASLDTPPGIDP